MKLTAKQEKFIDYYIELGNATEAAKKAGYKANSETAYQSIGSENLRKLEGFINKRLTEIESKRIADATEVMEYLTSVLRGESESEVVVVEGVGDGMSKARKIQKQPDERERLKAAELLGKRYRLFTDKVEVETERSEQFERILEAVKNIE